MAAEAQAQATDNLALKKTARRRLVGTVALVILSLLILPQILKNKTHSVPPPQEPRVIMPQEVPEVAAPIADAQPAQDTDSPVNESGFNTEVIAENLANEYDDTKPAITGQKPPQPTPQASKLTTEANMSEKAKESEAKAKEATAKLDKAPEKADKSSGEKSEKLTKKAQDTAKKEPVKSKVVKAAQKPVSKTEKKVAKPAGTKPQQGFAIQLGVFADPDNVKKMQAKIALAGFESKTSTVSKGTRLRVGNFVSRKGAEHALERLKQNGLTGKIVPQ